MSRNTSHRVTNVPAAAPVTEAKISLSRSMNPYDLDDDQELQDGFVLPPDSGVMAQENLEERVQTTQNRLSQLRAEAENLEREKLQFEELSRKQREFMSGRTEVAGKLNRAVTLLDRETYEAQKRVEQLLLIKDSFNHHLDMVDSLNPEQWNHQDLAHDLNRAIGMIEDARSEYLKGMGKVQLLSGSNSPAPSTAPEGVSGTNPDVLSLPRGLPIDVSMEAFRRWAFCGAAFTLPLAVVGLLYVLVRIIVR